jgi:hypothetical protein
LQGKSTTDGVEASFSMLKVYVLQDRWRHGMADVLRRLLGVPNDPKSIAGSHVHSVATHIQLIQQQFTQAHRSDEVMRMGERVAEILERMAIDPSVIQLVDDHGGRFAVAAKPKQPRSPTRSRASC